MPIEEKPPLRVCIKCHNEVEWCAFCEREDCGHAMCYRCLRLELRQSRPQVEDRAG